MRTSMGSARKPVPNSSMAVFHAVRWESDMVEGLKKQHETSSLAEHLHQIHQIVYRILYIVNTYIYVMYISIYNTYVSM